jgi:hypothetical protein
MILLKPQLLKRILRRDLENFPRSIQDTLIPLLCKVPTQYNLPPIINFSITLYPIYPENDVIPFGWCSEGL